LNSYDLSFAEALCDLSVRVSIRTFLGLQAVGAMTDANPSQGIGSVALANLSLVDDRRWSDRTFGRFERLPEQPIYALEDLSPLRGLSDRPVWEVLIGFSRRVTTGARSAVIGAVAGRRSAGRPPPVRAGRRPACRPPAAAGRRPATRGRTDRSVQRQWPSTCRDPCSSRADVYTSDPGANVSSSTTASNAHSHSGSDLDPEPHRDTFFCETLTRKDTGGDLPRTVAKLVVRFIGTSSRGLDCVRCRQVPRAAATLGGQAELLTSSLEPADVSPRSIT
jgi:hypothetical protein